jgi:hypothetical protein
LLTVCETDAVVAAQFFKVSGLIDPPTRLLKPSIVRRLLPAGTKTFSA